MQAARWHELKPLLDRALDLEAGARAEFVAALPDPELRGEVARLLALRQEPVALDRPMAELVAPLVATRDPGRDWDRAQLGRRFGAFELERWVGAGGMGTVYAARRREGEFEQQVAIKLVPSAHPGLRERCRSERRILAGLRHPHIAQLLDGGESEDGMPYLIMEYVEGVPITQYCRGRGLDFGAIVRLLVNAAGALAFAHRHLVVHRDIKPSNLLVTAEGHPKLLDFGIAELIDASQGAPSDTELRVGPMTPEYAAPEQFRGEPVTVATDVYQFGMLMYQLLTGRLPYDADPDDRQAWARAVLEAPHVPLRRRYDQARADPGPPHAAPEPERPPHPAPATRGYRRALVGDIEAIVSRCLAKSPDARYPSMDALSADLGAWLQQRPVEARGGGRWYRLRRFAARHLAAVAVASIAALGLLALSVYTYGQAELARAEAANAKAQGARAQQQNQRAEAALRFVSDMFQAADPNLAQGGRLSADDMLRHAAKRLERTLADQPDLRGTLRTRLGEMHLTLGELRQAMPLFAGAVEDLRTVADKEPLLLAHALERGGYTAQRVGELGRAKAWVAEAQALAAADTAETYAIRASALFTLYTMVRDASDTKAALGYAEQAVALTRRYEPDGEGPQGVRALAAWATALTDFRRFDQAEPVFRRLVELNRERYGEDDYRTLQAQGSIGWMLTVKNDGAAARRLLEPLSERIRALFGEHSQSYGNVLYSLGLAYHELGLLDQGIATFRRVAEIYGESAASHSGQRGWALSNVAAMELERDHYADALPVLEEIERSFEGSLAADSLTRVGLALDFARAYLGLRRWDLADQACGRALAIHDIHQSGGGARVDALELRAQVALGRGEPDAARAQYRLALADALAAEPRDQVLVARLERSAGK